MILFFWFWGWGDSLHLAQWLERRARDQKVPGSSPRSNQSSADDTILMISSPTDVKLWIWNWSLNSVTSSSERLVLQPHNQPPIILKTVISPIPAVGHKLQDLVANCILHSNHVHTGSKTTCSLMTSMRATRMED